MFRRTPYAEITKDNTINKFDYWHTGKKLLPHKVWIDRYGFNGLGFALYHLLSLLAVVPIGIMAARLVNDTYHHGVAASLTLTLFVVLAVILPTAVRLCLAPRTHITSAPDISFQFLGYHPEQILQTVSRTHHTELVTIGKNLYAEKMSYAPSYPPRDNEELSEKIITIWLNETQKSSIDHDTCEQVTANLTAIYEVTSGKNSITTAR